MMWSSRKMSARVLRFVTSFVLIIGLFVTGTLKEYGPVVAQAIEDSKVEYVSDVRLFYSTKSLDAAKDRCRANDYIPVEGDLNEGTDRDHVVMGYKTTEDRKEAICSIRLLSMDAGYEMKDYAELQDEYAKSNASTIDTIEAAAMEFADNYASGSPKAKEAYDGLNLIMIPEVGEKKLGDYIVDGDADWNFYAKVVTRSSSGTVSAILGYLTLGLSAYENEYDSDMGESVSMSWAEAVSGCAVWEEIEDAQTEDEFNSLYKRYGDDARAFHKKLQEFATGYDNAMATFDEEEYASELQSEVQGKDEEEVVNDKEELSENEQGVAYAGIYEQLNSYTTDDGTQLGDYLLELGYQTSDDVDLTKLYPVIECMSYAERRIAGMTGLLGLIQTTGENVTDDRVEDKISEAAGKIEDIMGSDSYSIWLNDNEEIKDKKVAYTSDAIRMDAAQKLIDDQDTSSWTDTANEVMKWVNMALGIVSCILTLAKFTIIAKAIALIPAGLTHIAVALGLIEAAKTVAEVAETVVAGATTAGGPMGWITLAVMVVSMLIIWAVTAIIKYIKENKDKDYEDAPEYVADRVEEDDRSYLAYYKGVGSDISSSDRPNDMLTEGNAALQEADLDLHGEDGISDVNGRMGFRGWNCMFYSKDMNAGSPIIVEKGEAPFKVLTGDAGINPVKGYDSVKSFGEIMPGNCNALMKKDEKGGVFVHYRTEKSTGNSGTAATATGSAVSGEEDEDRGIDDGAKQSGVYYKDIIVRSADTEQLAKAKIRAKGYKIWDNNLANDVRYKYTHYHEWSYTYIGFITTTDPKKAIKDIRVATFTPQSSKEVSFGDVKYGCAGNLGYKAENATEDKEYPNDLDGLWITTDEKAGTPIEVGGLHITQDHADGKYVNEGWVPVTTFSGVPYNFASTRDSDSDDWRPGRVGNAGYSYTGYSTDKDDTWECPARYIYYEPLEKYTSGTKYLSALFFTFGTDSESTASKVGETTAKFSDLIDRMKKTPNTVIYDNTNLAESFFYKGYVVESNQKYLHMGYSWSYNPYRALTDVKVFQGTIYAANLPYTISKPTASGANISYDSVSVVTQRSTRKSWVTRGISPENAYMFPSGLLGTNKQVCDGYTSYQPGGYDYAKKNMPFIATGLYVSGPADGLEKLTLDDVIISSNAHEAVNNGGVIAADVSGETTLAGSGASGEWNSIQEMKAPFETKPFNIAYPEFTNDDDDHKDAGTPFYMYIRKTAMKRKYISKVYVGSYSFEDTKQEDDKSVNKEVAKQVDLRALVAANQVAVDEVIPANASLIKNSSWYDIKAGDDDCFNKWQDSLGGIYDGDEVGKESENRLPWNPPESEKISGDDSINVDRPASYISVTRTDNPNQAVRGLLLYKTKEKNAPEKISVGGVEYICASTSTPIIMRKYTDHQVYDGYNAPYYKWTKEKCFLYYTTNKGATPGSPITEITVDSNVFNSGQSTVLTVDKKDKITSSADGRKTITDKAIPFGDCDAPKYIHATYEKDPNTLFNKIYVGSGKSKTEALLQLLEQGCTEYVDMDLNEGVSLSGEELEDDNEKHGGKYVYFGYRGFSVKGTKESEIEDQMVDAIYDIVCTVGEKFHPEGIVSEKKHIYYTPVFTMDKKGNSTGVNLNDGADGAKIYMYYTTPWVSSKYNEKIGSDVRKDRSVNPKDILKSPLTRICFTTYDRVPYSKDSGVDPMFGDDARAWEYVLYSDGKTHVDLNDGTFKFDDDYLTENNRINMFVQRMDGSVKGAAEITGGFVSGKLEIGEMWLNR